MPSANIVFNGEEIKFDYKNLDGLARGVRMLALLEDCVNRRNGIEKTEPPLLNKKHQKIKVRVRKKML